uniref:Putative amino acid permease n=1 Tax=Trypanosoma congolense (strain IL3000) TaxID=1068625 RepID=G0UWM4_TRYCI|nr:putative amino acid permease [Trypanosoma congolense IL3000]
MDHNATHKAELGDDLISSRNDDHSKLEKSASVQPERNGLIGFSKKLFSTLIPHGGTLSNSFNFASATLGGSIVTLPWAFHAVGIVMGTIYLVFMALMTIYTITIMGFVMKKTNLNGFEQMSLGLLGRGAAYVMSGAMALSCVGAAIAYVIAVRSLLTPMLLRSSEDQDFLHSTVGIQFVTFLVWLLGMLPLVVPKEINSLRYFSAVGVSFVVYFAVVILVHAALAGLPKRSEVVMVQKGNIAIEGFGVFIFAYFCHCVAYPVYYEMNVPMVRRLCVDATVSMLFCSVLYWFVGVFAYFEFGQEIKDSVLLMYDPVKEPMILVGYIGLITKLCASYGLNMVPFRNTVYFLLKWDIQKLSYTKHISMVTLMSVAVLLCGLYVPKISTVFNFVGSVCGGLIGFIYPALFYMYSGNWSLSTVGCFCYIMTYCTLIIGVASVVFGTCATVYSVVVGV